MSRLVHRKAWRLTLLGCVCLTLSGLGMASMQVVPDTTGKDFFLPSTTDLDPFPLFDILEVVATRAGKGQASQANLTLTTTSGDVVLALTIPTNQTAHISLQNLGRRNGDGYRLSSTVEVSVYGHLSNGSDVITMIPLDDLGTAYLVSDLCVFDCAETVVIVFSTVVNTTVKVVYYYSSEVLNVSAPTSQREDTLQNSPSGNSTSDNAGAASAGGGGGGGQNTSVVSSTAYSIDISNASRIGNGGVDAAPNSSSATISSSSQTVGVSPNGSTAASTTTTTTLSTKSSGTITTLQGVAADAFTAAPATADPATVVAAAWGSRSFPKVSEHFLASSLQTFVLDIPRNATIFLQAAKPVGIFVLVRKSSSSSSLSSSSSSASTSQAPGAVSTVEHFTQKSSTGNADGTLAGAGQSSILAGEMVPPVSSLGMQFYFPLLSEMNFLKLVISGQENTSILLHWDGGGKVEMLHYFLAANTSLSIDQPSLVSAAGGYFWLTSLDFPVLVHVVTEICLPATTEGAAGVKAARKSVNAFFLPPLEQYFRCYAEPSSNSCVRACPRFWSSQPCTPGQESTEGQKVGIFEGQRSWDIYQTSNATSVGKTDICVSANDSFMQFRLNADSATFAPAGTRLAKLYRACAKDIIAKGGLGDGIDNDCDGLIDEEVENMLDDDGDGSIDEDTSDQCASDVNSRTPRSGDLQRAVADPMTQLYDYDDDESGMPLLAVIISLSTAIFAVILVISVFLLMELMTRRRQIRNTKIRPFVS